jgi:hypothetical protein
MMREVTFVGTPQALAAPANAPANSPTRTAPPQAIAQLSEGSRQPIAPDRPPEHCWTSTRGLPVAREIAGLWRRMQSWEAAHVTLDGN